MIPSPYPLVNAGKFFFPLEHRRISILGAGMLQTARDASVIVLAIQGMVLSNKGHFRSVVFWIY